MALGFTRPWNRAIIALAGSPGISRGMKKFTVIAAHSVSKKNPSLCSRNLIDYLRVRTPPSRPTRSALGRQVQHDLLVVRDLPGRGERVRVLLGRPAGEGTGVVLVPVDALRRRDHRDVTKHRLLHSVQELVLGGLVGLREVVERLVDGRVLVPLVVARGGLAQWRAVGAVQDLLELVVRPRA